MSFSFVKTLSGWTDIFAQIVATALAAGMSAQCYAATRTVESVSRDGFDYITANGQIWFFGTSSSSAWAFARIAGDGTTVLESQSGSSSIGAGVIAGYGDTAGITVLAGGYPILLLSQDSVHHVFCDAENEPMMFAAMGGAASGTAGAMNGVNVIVQRDTDLAPVKMDSLVSYTASFSETYSYLSAPSVWEGLRSGLNALQHFGYGTAVSYSGATRTFRIGRFPNAFCGYDAAGTKSAGWKYTSSGTPIAEATGETAASHAAVFSLAIRIGDTHDTDWP